MVRDILNERNLKSRSEIMMHFIRVAKRLHELNNLHSLVAVVLAIDSPPIARLQLTWKVSEEEEKRKKEESEGRNGMSEQAWKNFNFLSLSLSSMSQGRIRIVWIDYLS